MGAFAQSIGGRPGRHEEFIAKVELILSGDEPHAMRLMQFHSRVRQTGRPVIWIHHMEDAPGVPLIGLVALAGDQVFTIEDCLLWSSPDSRTTQLVPDNFKLGAFVFDDELKLNHLPKAPARNLNAARAGIVRGDVFALPHLARAA